MSDAATQARSQSQDESRNEADLHAALNNLLAQGASPAPADLARFLQSLTMARGVALAPSDPDSPPLQVIGRMDMEAARAAMAALAHSARAQRLGAGLVGIALPGTAEGPVLVALRFGAEEETLQALAHERLELVRAALAQRAARGGGLALLCGDAAAAARGDGERAQRLIDLLARRWAARRVALVDPAKPGAPVRVSGRPALAKRSALAAELRARAPAAELLGEGASARALVVDGARPDAGDLAALDAIWRAAVAGRRSAGWRRWGPTALVGLIPLALAMTPVTESDSLVGRVTAQAHRVATVPFDGRVAAVMARAGQVVAAGDPLFEMDVAPLVLERARLLAEQAEPAAALAGARAGGDAARAAQAEIALQQSELRIAAVEDKIATAMVAAPISGIVGGEAPERLEGAYLGLGAVVIELSDPERLRLRIETTPRARARLRVGDEVAFSADAAPAERVATTIGHIDVLPEERPDGPRFIAYSAPLPPEATSGLADGMIGVARIDHGRAPLGVLIWRRLRDWALINLAPWD